MKFACIAIPILATSVCSCKGASIRNDLFVQGGSPRPFSSRFEYEDSRQWVDHTPEVNLEQGVGSADFYKTIAKYEFLTVFLAGVKSNGNDTGTLASLRTELDTAYAESKLGNAISRERIDRMFDAVLDIYPKDNPVAQYNLGIVYINLHEDEKARKWLEKSAEAGFLPAAIRLQALQHGRTPR